MRYTSAIALASLAAGTAAQGEAKCSPLHLVYARATTEPPTGVDNATLAEWDAKANQIWSKGYGAAGASLVFNLTALMKEATSYPVHYPASMGQSLPKGVTDMLQHIDKQAKACPDQKFALGGHSQGGMVTVNAIPKIPKEQLDRVVAVTMFGSPPCPAQVEGRCNSYCLTGDFVCDPAKGGKGAKGKAGTPPGIPKGDTPPKSETPKGDNSPKVEGAKGDAGTPPGIPKGDTPPKSETPKGDNSPKVEGAKGKTDTPPGIPKGDTPPKSETPKGDNSPKVEGAKGEIGTPPGIPNGNSPPKSETPKGDNSPKVEGAKGETGTPPGIPNGDAPPKSETPKGDNSPKVEGAKAGSPSVLSALDERATMLYARQAKPVADCAKYGPSNNIQVRGKQQTTKGNAHLQYNSDGYHVFAATCYILDQYKKLGGAAGAGAPTL